MRRVFPLWPYVIDLAADTERKSLDIARGGETSLDVIYYGR